MYKKKYINNIIIKSREFIVCRRLFIRISLFLFPQTKRCCVFVCIFLNNIKCISKNKKKTNEKECSDKKNTKFKYRYMVGSLFLIYLYI